MFFQRAETAVRLNGLEAARAFFSGCLTETDCTKEHLWIAHVDDHARCLHLSQHVGHESGASIALTRLIQDVARLGSAGIVLAHNHLSGDAMPSEVDRAFTKRLATVSEAMDVVILDHLIFAGEQWRSMRQLGWL